MSFFKEIFKWGSFVRSLNAIFFFSLIPNKEDVKDLKDFRSTSWVGGLSKVLAKFLANRLRRVVGKVASNFQHAFMKVRKILDGVHQQKIWGVGRRVALLQGEGSIWGRVMKSIKMEGDLLSCRVVFFGGEWQEGEVLEG